MIDGVKQFEKYEMVDGVKNSTFESVTLLSKKYNFIKGSFLTMVISQSDIVRELSSMNSRTDLLRSMQASGSFARINIT